LTNLLFETINGDVEGVPVVLALPNESAKAVPNKRTTTHKVLFMDRPPPRASATLPQKLTSRFAEEDPAHRAILCEAHSDDGNVLRVGGAVVKMKLLAHWVGLNCD